MKFALAVQTPEVKKEIPVALLSGRWEEKLEKAARFGAQGLELMTVRPQDLDANAMRRQFETAGLQAAAVASGGVTFCEGLTLLHNDALRASQARMRLNQLIEFAGKLGAPLVTIGSFKGRLSNVPGQGESLLQEIIVEAAAYAKTHSVSIVIEPLNRYETDFLRNSLEVNDFILKLDRANIGMLLDTFHVNIEESSWTEPFKKACETGQLWHVHIGDNNRLPPGKGLIDFKSILETLSSSNYSGFVSAELLAKPDPDEAARQTLNHLHNLIGG